MGGMRWQEKGRRRGLPPGEVFRRPRSPAHGHAWHAVLLPRGGGIRLPRMSNTRRREAPSPAHKIIRAARPIIYESGP